MKEKAKQLLDEMTLDEKIHLLTGAYNMITASVERLGLKAVNMADGPHGVRMEQKENCTAFPNLCAAGATWDVDLIEKMGEAIARDCIQHNVDVILGPGVNIKRHILCGRNFEYFSEDPVLSGEMGAAYVRGVQSLGVGTSVKHFALNNQEIDRQTLSIDVDFRTMMEIYLKAFEIIVKKSAPASIMCAYNKIHSIWCSENKFLLTEILRDMWGYDGVVVSDWGAVHNSVKALSAGLDLQMPSNENIVEEIKSGIKNGDITEKEVNMAVERIIRFMLNRPKQKPEYNRQAQHDVARKVAAASNVLLKNNNKTLPITKEKYKKISVVGEFGKYPLISGQGSAEVNPLPEYIDSPITEMQKILGDEVEINYVETYSKTAFSKEMLWPKGSDFCRAVENSDIIIMFVGAMESEDTEKFDKRTANLNPNYELFINVALGMDIPVVVVLQSGSAMILGNWHNEVDSIVQMWLGGEAAGGGIADVLCGKVNPGGKLTETFPTKLRSDLPYPGNGYTLEYSEKLFVGYRYYDKHPEEIIYPFGHGLSYTDFEYSNLEINRYNDVFKVEFDLKNMGDVVGSEVVQLYTGDPVATVVRPEKELKAFKKVELNPGEVKKVALKIELKDLAYYNVLLKDWITEPGKYVIYIGSSSRDIRLEKTIIVEESAPYSLDKKGEDMIG